MRKPLKNSCYDSGNSNLFISPVSGTQHILSSKRRTKRSTCGFGLVEVYSQTLWTEINKTDHVTLQNGIVVAVYTLIGVVGAYFAGYFRIDWSKMSIFVFSAYFSISGALLIYTSYTNSVYVSYAVYCRFCGLYQFMVTVAFSEISQRIPPDSYGLILGLNSFVALVLQSIVTFVVINMLHEPVREQYLIFGLCHLLIFAVYLSYELFRMVYSKLRFKDDLNLKV